MPRDSDASSGAALPLPFARERAALDRLARQGGESLARDIAALYVEEMPARLSAARAALESGDASLLARMAHMMKSSSAQLGAESLAEACEAVEEAAEGEDLPRAAAQLSLVETQYDSFRAWLASGTALRDASADGGRPLIAGPIVAVVEDNADNRLLIDALLGDRFVLDEYASGVEALAGIRSRRPAVVLLDISLPGMDGLEVLARIRGDVHLRDLPVIALTAHAMAGDRDRYIAAGFDEYVAKPIVDEHVLLCSIEHVRSRRAGRRGVTSESSEIG